MKRRHQRGAALVEFALILPVLALLVFGMIDFGVSFNQLNSLRQGTREGARQAVVANFGGDSSCSVIGASPNTTTRELVCLVKDRVGLGDQKTRVMVGFRGDNEPGESLLVCAQHPLDSMTGFFGPALANRTLRTKVEMRIEQSDDDLQATAETPPPGGGWGWCS